MKFHVQHLRQSGCGVRLHRAVSIMAALAVFMTAGSARALESVKQQTPGVAGTVPSSIVAAPASPAEKTDSCLALLHAARYDSAPSAMSREVREDAGSAAAVGLILGVRFALGPKQVTSRSYSDGQRGPSASFYIADVADTRDGGARGSHALAISAYRSCRNEQALKALSSEWRWSR